MEIKPGLWEFWRSDRTGAIILATAYRDTGKYAKIKRTHQGKGYSVFVSTSPSLLRNL